MTHSQFIILPLSLYKNYVPSVVKALKRELETDSLELKDEQQLLDYLNRGTFVMCDTRDNKNKLVGFFSLSRVDEFTAIGIIMQIWSLMISYLFGRMYVYDFCILDKYRKKGCGVVMMQCLEHYCLNNYPLLRWLELHTQKEELTYFYNKCGFSLTKRVNSVNVFTKKLI